MQHVFASSSPWTIEFRGDCYTGINKHATLDTLSKLQNAFFNKISKQRILFMGYVTI